MNINDYLLDQDGVNWGHILSDWSWLIPTSFTVWLANRFGDLFIVLDDGSVHLLDTGRGVIERLADNRDDFCKKMDEGSNAENWLLISIVDELVQSGKVLKAQTVYSFIKPPVLGGKYDPQNFEVTDIAVHYSVFGQLLKKIKDLPEGTKIGEIKITNG